MRRPDNGAAQREHAPIGDHHANLRQQINGEQSADTEYDFAKPISERRTDAAIETEFVADREELGQVARRRKIECCRYNEPYCRLCQRSKPEHELRP